MDELEKSAGCVVGSAVIAGIIDPAVGYESPWYSGRSGLILADPKPCVLIPLRGQIGLNGSGIESVRFIRV